MVTEMTDQMMRSRYDCLKSQVFRRRQKFVSDCADVVSSGKFWQGVPDIRGPATVKALLATVEGLMGGTYRVQLVVPAAGNW